MSPCVGMRFVRYIEYITVSPLVASVSFVCVVCRLSGLRAAVCGECRIWVLGFGRVVGLVCLSAWVPSSCSVDDLLCSPVFVLVVGALLASFEP